MKLAIIIVSYNSFNDIIELLESIKQQEIQPDYIIIVDNNSPNGDGKNLKNLENDNIIVLNAQKNGWFAYWCNIWIKKAIKLWSTHIGLVNPDAILIYKDIFSQILRSFEVTSYDLIGTYVYNAKNHKIEFWWWKIQSIFFYPYSLHFREIYTMYSKIPHIGTCEYITGSSFFFKSSVIEDIWYLDESYFLYFEETDWCMRAKKYWKKIWVLSSVSIAHNTSSSIGFRSKLYTLSMIKNYAKFALTWAKWYQLPFWFLLYALFWVPGQIIGYIMWFFNL